MGSGTPTRFRRCNCINQSPRRAALGFQQLAKELDGAASIPSGLHQDVDLVPVLVDRPPHKYCCRP